MTDTNLPNIDVSTRPQLTLGMIAMDHVTGFSGAVVLLTEMIDGSTLVAIQPRGLTESGGPKDPYEFDMERVKVVEDAPLPVLNAENTSSRVEIKLGQKYRDKVSGFEGIAIRRLRWLGGCDHVVLTSKVNKDNEVKDQRIPVEQAELVEVPKPKVTVQPTRTGGPGTLEKRMLARSVR